MNFSFWEKTMFFKKVNLIFAATIFVAFSGSLAEAQTKKGSDTDPNGYGILDHKGGRYSLDGKRHGLLSSGLKT